MTDEKLLIDRVRKGDRSAFRTLVEHHQKAVYFLALDLTGNHHDAEDLSQDVFVKAYRSLNSFRGDARLSTWLYRITVNTHINQVRRKAFNALDAREDIDIVAGGNPGSGNPEKQAEAGLIQHHIEAALKRLTPRERSVFTLRHYQDLPLREIARTLKVTEGTVKSTLFRAIQKLQQELAFYRSEKAGGQDHENL